MHPKIKEKMYDRLAELVKSHDDPERFFQYLENEMNKEVKPVLTVGERQKRLIEKRKELGFTRMNCWLSNTTIEELKKIFPGVKGGIDWLAVSDTALKAQSKRKSESK